MLILGSKLNYDQRRQVLAAFVHRHLDTTVRTDDEWLERHAFNFTKAGRLARGSAQPAFMAGGPVYPPRGGKGRAARVPKGWEIFPGARARGGSGWFAGNPYTGNADGPFDTRPLAAIHARKIDAVVKVSRAPLLPLSERRYLWEDVSPFTRGGKGRKRPAFGASASTDLAMLATAVRKLTK